MTETTLVATGLAAVRQEIARACCESRREPSSVTLVAVSKTFGAAAIEPVIAQGQTVFGENRVQEAKAKWLELRWCSWRSKRGKRQRSFAPSGELSSLPRLRGRVRVGAERD